MRKLNQFKSLKVTQLNQQELKNVKGGDGDKPVDDGTIVNGAGGTWGSYPIPPDWTDKQP
jgi:natural product precursor